MYKKILSVFCLLAFAISIKASATEETNISLPVTKFKLENGLTVILLEDHTVPMVSYHTWYRVGSLDESVGVTGAAHMLEHMMFKGAKKYSGKEFDHILHENGIVNNAFTTHDYTGFYQNLPSSKLDLMMDMEVDRMSSLNLNPDDLKSEKEVVKEERRWRVDNNPTGSLHELLMGTAFESHPYKWPVIGYMRDIEQYTADKLRFFYETFYVPNNAILVLVGDFKTSDVKSKIEKVYGNLKYRPLPRRESVSEPEQTAAQSAILKKDVQNKSVVMAFKTVAQGHEDMYALDLAASLLGNGSSSRLYRKLVYQKQMATGSYSYSTNMKEQGLFVIGVNMKPGLGTSEAVQIVNSEISKLKNNLVTDAELKKIKTQLLKDHIDSLRTMDGKARALAVNEIMTGSYESLFTDIPKYEKVTAQDIQRVAKKYFNTKQQTTVQLEPTKGNAEKAE